MKTQEKIVTETSNSFLGWFDSDEFIELDEETMGDLLKRKDFREKLIEAIRCSFVVLRDAVIEDLKDIWKRLDHIEQ